MEKHERVMGEYPFPWLSTNLNLFFCDITLEFDRGLEVRSRFLIYSTRMLIQHIFL